MASAQERKGILAKLLSHPYAGIAFNQHYGGDGAIIFKHACALGCKGIVSKRLGSSYRSFGHTFRSSSTEVLISELDSVSVVSGSGRIGWG